MNISFEEIVHGIRSFAEMIVAIGALIIFVQNWRQSRALKAVKKDVEIVQNDVKEVHKLTNSLQDKLVAEVRESALKNGEAKAKENLATGIAVGLEKGEELGLKKAQDAADAKPA